MINLIKKYRERKLERLQSIARGLGSVLPYINDKEKQDMGYKNLDRIQKEITKLYDKIYKDDRREFYD